MEKYKIGYIAGVFDLFHIGHLNILKKSRNRCKQLIVGVLSDELVEHFKGKKPYIQDIERLEIVQNIKCVDKAVIVTFENIDKIDAWNLHHFDCLFSGDDWKDNESWNIDKKRLIEVESNIEFFEYTKGTSSTQIKKKIFDKDGIC